MSSKDVAIDGVIAAPVLLVPLWARIATFGKPSANVCSWRYLLVAIDETNGNTPPQGRSSFHGSRIHTHDPSTTLGTAPGTATFQVNFGRWSLKALSCAQWGFATG